MWLVVLCETATIIANERSSAGVLQILTPSGAECTSRIAITPTFLIGMALQVVGGIIRKLCYRTLGRHFTFELSLRENHQLVTSGPYSIVRHPSYTGITMVFAGMLMCQLGAGSWLAECGMMNSIMGRIAVCGWVAHHLYVTATLLARMGKEDEVLKREFGPQWEQWARKTRHRLIPGVY
ncbi:hypothetical protein WOLCODRAFT_167544 [Wolfiporia cocos MD-104 SS10]|uniref:Protein-S-isoprenylcysteine O-methyltransferase n=1 Tax=Wolfiporia cocos (strain MD-104) TaxID=742152 RepID=A0A2H3J5I1_WOLCO|nr:hypothetical protein WOLCODRAFT_167544 [Wolfiporia cocos MD-104 SS10]